MASSFFDSYGADAVKPRSSSYPKPQPKTEKAEVGPIAILMRC